MAVEFEFEKKLKGSAEAVNAALKDYLGQNDPDFGALCNSMRYSSLNGGKRARAFLTLEFFSVFGGKNPEAAIPVACAIEMVHTYSLIHDDLPCMDDDDFRRGQLSNHKKFGEAVALLAGDALLTYAFGIIADAKFLPGEKKLRIISELSRAAGHFGMVGGQAMDMLCQNENTDIQSLFKMHALKTGKMMAVSAKSGCIAAGAGERETELAAKYAEKIGLAFQIVDDILDKGDYGKKNNFVNVFGGDGGAAFECAENLTGEALAHIEDLNMDTGSLGIFAKYLLERRN